MGTLPNRRAHADILNNANGGMRSTTNQFERYSVKWENQEKNQSRLRCGTNRKEETELGTIFHQG